MYHLKNILPSRYSYYDSTECVALNPEKENQIHSETQKIVPEEVFKVFISNLHLSLDPKPKAICFGASALGSSSLLAVLVLSLKASTAFFGTFSCLCASISFPALSCAGACCCIICASQVNQYSFLKQFGDLQNILDETGKNAFYYAIDYTNDPEESLRLCNWLLSKHACLDFEGPIDHSPFALLIKKHSKADTQEEKEGWFTIARLLFANGLPVDTVCKKTNSTLPYLAFVAGSNSFFRWLLAKDAPLEWIGKDDKTYRILNGVVIDQLKNLVETKKDDLETMLDLFKRNTQTYNEDLLLLYQKIKSSQKSTLSFFLSEIPGLKAAKIYGKMRLIHNFFPIKAYYRLEEFEFDGLFLSPYQRSQIANLLQQFIENKLGGLCRESTKQLLIYSLKAFSFTPRFEDFSNPNTPFMMNIGYSCHAIYLWMYQERFILVDTAELIGKTFFNNGCCWQGSFDRSLFSEKVFQALERCKDLSLDDPSYLEILKTALIDSLNPTCAPKSRLNKAELDKWKTQAAKGMSLDMTKMFNLPIGKCRPVQA